MLRLMLLLPLEQSPKWHNQTIVSLMLRLMLSKAKALKLSKESSNANEAF